MDIFAVLKRDHQRLSDQIMRLKSEDDEDTAEHLFEDLKLMLDEHARGEEALVYSVLSHSDANTDQELATAARDEHEQVDQLVAELDDCDFGGERWDERLLDLERALRAHAEMEEGRLFGRLRELLDDGEAQRRGRLMSDAEPTVRRQPPPAETGVAPLA